MTRSPAAADPAYSEAFEASIRHATDDYPGWAITLREKAFAQFQQLGFPVSRVGNEEWKYTDLGPLAKTRFVAPLAPEGSFVPASSAIEHLLLGGESWRHLVFVDSNYAPDLSSTGASPHGQQVLSLHDALQNQGDLLRAHLSRHALVQDNAFIALNTAFLQDGAILYIPDGTRVETPIQILFLATNRQQSLHLHPRVLIVLGRESQATIIESYESLDGGSYFSNAVTELALGDNSTIEYYKLQRQSSEAFHITNTQVTMGRNSSFRSVNIDLGGRLVRNNLNILMDGEGAACSLLGLYLTTGVQHVDNQVIIDHAKPHTTSREIYKGILHGKSRSVFHGSIVVRQGARKVDAQQEDRNLLLSDKAEADTKPAFWIYCDDIMARHGAACGKIDPTALLYLQSRGMDELTARNFLVHGFAAEIIRGITCEPVSSFVDREVRQRLRVWLEDTPTRALNT